MVTLFSVVESDDAAMDNTWVRFTVNTYKILMHETNYQLLIINLASFAILCLEFRPLDRHVSLRDFGLPSNGIKEFMEMFTMQEQDGSLSIMPSLIADNIASNSFPPHIFQL